MQKGIFTRIKIALVKFRDTYFTGVQRIFRYSQRLEAKLDELENKFQNFDYKLDGLKLELAYRDDTLKEILEYSKINQAFMNLEEKSHEKRILI